MILKETFLLLSVIFIFFLSHIHSSSIYDNQVKFSTNEVIIPPDSSGDQPISYINPIKLLNLCSINPNDSIILPFDIEINSDITIPQNTEIKCYISFLLLSNPYTGDSTMNILSINGTNDPSITFDCKAYNETYGFNFCQNMIINDTIIFEDELLTIQLSTSYAPNVLSEWTYQSGTYFTTGDVVPTYLSNPFTNVTLLQKNIYFCEDFDFSRFFNTYSACSQLEQTLCTEYDSSAVNIQIDYNENNDNSSYFLSIPYQSSPDYISIDVMLECINPKTWLFYTDYVTISNMTFIDESYNILDIYRWQIPKRVIPLHPLYNWGYFVVSTSSLLSEILLDEPNRESPYIYTVPYNISIYEHFKFNMITYDMLNNNMNEFSISDVNSLSSQISNCSTTRVLSLIITSNYLNVITQQSIEKDIMLFNEITTNIYYLLSTYYYLTNQLENNNTLSYDEKQLIMKKLTLFSPLLKTVLIDSSYLLTQISGCDKYLTIDPYINTTTNQTFLPTYNLDIFCPIMTTFSPISLHDIIDYTPNDENIEDVSNNAYITFASQWNYNISLLSDSSYQNTMPISTVDSTSDILDEFLMQYTLCSEICKNEKNNTQCENYYKSVSNRPIFVRFNKTLTTNEISSMYIPIIGPNTNIITNSTSENIGFLCPLANAETCTQESLCYPSISTNSTTIDTTIPITTPYQSGDLYTCSALNSILNTFSNLSVNATIFEHGLYTCSSQCGFGTLDYTSKCVYYQPDEEVFLNHSFPLPISVNIDSTTTDYTTTTATTIAMCGNTSSSQYALPQDEISCVSIATCDPSSVIWYYTVISDPDAASSTTLDTIQEYMRIPCHANDIIRKNNNSTIIAGNISIEKQCYNQTNGFTQTSIGLCQSLVDKNILQFVNQSELSIIYTKEFTYKDAICCDLSHWGFNCEQKIDLSSISITFTNSTNNNEIFIGDTLNLNISIPSSTIFPSMLNVSLIAKITSNNTINNTINITEYSIIVQKSLSLQSLLQQPILSIELLPTTILLPDNDDDDYYISFGIEYINDITSSFSSKKQIFSSCYDTNMNYNQCSIHGTCNPYASGTASSPHCICDIDYTGETCSQTLCDEIQCLTNHGTSDGVCVIATFDDIAYPSCASCMGGYYGNICQFSAKCNPNNIKNLEKSTTSFVTSECHNHGYIAWNTTDSSLYDDNIVCNTECTCQATNMTLYSASYTVPKTTIEGSISHVIPGNWTGESCETCDINCLNGQIFDTQCVCHCIPGFYGNNCECADLVISISFEKEPDGYNNSVIGAVWKNNILIDISNDLSIDQSNISYINGTMINNTFVIFISIQYCSEISTISTHSKISTISTTISTLSATFSPLSAPLYPGTSAPQSLLPALSHVSSFSSQAVNVGTTSTNINDLYSSWSQLQQQTSSSSSSSSGSSGSASTTYVGSGSAASAAGGISSLNNASTNSSCVLDPFTNACAAATAQVSTTSKGSSSTVTIIAVVVVIVGSLALIIAFLLLLCLCRAKQWLCWSQPSDEELCDACKHQERRRSADFVSTTSSSSLKKTHSKPLHPTSSMTNIHENIPCCKLCGDILPYAGNVGKVSSPLSKNQKQLRRSRPPTGRSTAGSGGNSGSGGSGSGSGSGNGRSRQQQPQQQQQYQQRLSKTPATLSPAGSPSVPKRKSLSSTVFQDSSIQLSNSNQLSHSSSMTASTQSSHIPSIVSGEDVPDNDVTPLPSHWVKMRSTNDGKMYFCNTETLQTSWNRPNADGTVNNGPGLF